MVPGAIEPELFGMKLEEVFEMEPEEYCARVLAGVCEAALENSKSSRGMLINYAQLPETVLTHILNFFGVEHSDSETKAMQRAARLDANNPAVVERGFEMKHKGATEAMRRAVARWVLPVYEQLEAARIGT